MQFQSLPDPQELDQIHFISEKFGKFNFIIQGFNLLLNLFVTPIQEQVFNSILAIFIIIFAAKTFQKDEIIKCQLFFDSLQFS